MSTATKTITKMSDENHRQVVIKEIRTLKHSHFTSQMISSRVTLSTRQVSRVCSWLRKRGYLQVTGQLKINGESAIYNTYQTTNSFHELIASDPLQILSNTIVDLGDLRKKRCESCKGCSRYNNMTEKATTATLVAQVAQLTKIFSTIANLLLGATNVEDIENMKHLMQRLGEPVDDLFS